MPQIIQFTLPSYLPEGHVVPIEVAGKSLALAKVKDKFHVFENFCPHAGCSFSGSGGIYNGVLVCDCHGAEFNLETGAVLQGPAIEAIRVFAAEPNETGLEIILP